MKRAAAMASSALISELEHCRLQGIDVAVWWRDDDVTTLDAPLERLLAVAQDLDATIDLAVIPALVDASLARMLAPAKSFDVMQHGLLHRNHAGAQDPKNEFGPERDIHDRLADLLRGRLILEERFQDQFIPILAPPWNRFDDALIEWLPSVGLNGLSKYSQDVRQQGQQFPGQLDVQIDLYDWDHRRSLTLTEMSDAMAHRIRINRIHATGRFLPIGLLTHHELHDSAFETALHEFLRTMLACPAVSMSSARHILRRQGIVDSASI